MNLLPLNNSRHVANELDHLTTRELFIQKAIDDVGLERVKKWLDASKVVGRRPRDYQQEMIDKIVGANRDSCLLVMPTSSGKTLVAAHVIARFNRKVALFVVKDNALLKQQQDALGREFHAIFGKPKATARYQSGNTTYINNTVLTTKCYSLNALLKMPHIYCVVLTAGLLANEVPFLNWNLLDVIVFDEVHNAVGNSPFVQVLNRIPCETHLEADTRTCVLGLSASPGSKKTPDASRMEIEKLANRLSNGKQQTVHLFSIDQSDPRLLGEPATIVIKRIDSRATAVLMELSRLEAYFREELGMSNGTTVNAGEVEKRLKSIRDEVELDPSDHDAWLSYRMLTCFAMVRDVRISNLRHVLSETLREAEGKKYLTPERIARLRRAAGGLESTMESEHPKLVALKSDITRYLQGTEGKVIVRVETRAVARELCLILDEELSLATTLLLGLEEFSRSQMNAAVEQFRNGSSRVLLATSVIQEGIDVPVCGLVIAYDASTCNSGQKLIQLRGRARANEGRLIVYCEDDVDVSAVEMAMTQMRNQGEAVRGVDSRREGWG